MQKRKMKIKLTWKIWLLIFVLVMSLISIFATPNFLQKGVLIENVESNSTAFEQGLGTSNHKNRRTTSRRHRTIHNNNSK